MRCLGILLFTIFQIGSIYSYTINHNNNFQENEWSEGRRDIGLNLVPSNSSGISTADLESILQSSISQWESSNNQINLSYLTQSSTPLGTRNNIFFSDSSLYFTGSSVAAITQTIFMEGSNEILKADIIINDSKLFTSTPGSSPYFGDVLTHELGHLLGLGHSSTHFSTMFYSLVNGQSSVSHDDFHGLQHIYPNSSSNFVKGRVQGGDGVNIFGAKVEFFNAETGEVIASTYTDQNGVFQLFSLDRDTKFLVSVSPEKLKSVLPSKFSFAQNNFCDLKTDYKYSFVESCESRKRGRPNIFIYNGGTQDLGTFTIRCGPKTPLNYLSDKTTGFDFTDTTYYSDTMTGYFSTSEINLSTPDIITLDLTGVTNAAFNTYYLKYFINSQKLYSPVQLQLDVSSPHHTATYTTSLDTDGNTSLDHAVTIPLSNITTNNIFTITITPTIVNAILQDDYFPDSTNYLQEDAIYSSWYFLQLDNGTSLVNQGFAPQDSTVDNTMCLEGKNSQSIRIGTGLEQSQNEIVSRDEDDVIAASCGTIGPPSNRNRISFFLSLLLILLLDSLSKAVKNKTNGL